MIGFFRRIRKKLADENQFFKYGKYAIGEIVLVVVGILIALSINNWNERRKEKIAACNYFENLLIDLKADYKMLTDFNSRNDFFEQEGFYLLNFLENELVEIDSVRLVKALLLSSYGPDYIPVSTTYDELIYSGDIKLLKDSDLKRRLDDYYMKDAWMGNFNDRIRHTMWYDYQDELLTVVNPLLFREIYALPTEEKTIRDDNTQGLFNVDTTYLNWIEIRKNGAVKKHLQRILSHRVQLRGQFDIRIRKIEVLLEQIRTFSCLNCDSTKINDCD